MAKKNFKYSEADKAEPIVFEQVFAEKSGGGVVPNQTSDLKKGIALGFDGGTLKPIKAYVLLEAVATADTTITIAKGSGVVVGDAIGNAKKAVACTAVDTTTHDDKDVVTVTMGVEIANGTVLYQAAAAHATTAKPIYTPSYLLGTDVEAGVGAAEVKLVNGANVRKETALVADEVVALMKGIQKV